MLRSLTLWGRRAQITRAAHKDVSSRCVSFLKRQATRVVHISIFNILDAFFLLLFPRPQYSPYAILMARRLMIRKDHKSSVRLYHSRAHGGEIHGGSITFSDKHRLGRLRILRTESITSPCICRRYKLMPRSRARL